MLSAVAIAVMALTAIRAACIAAITLVAESTDKIHCSLLTVRLQHCKQP